MSIVDVNKKAPNFELMDFKGQIFKLSDYLGKKNIVIVLNRGFM